MKDRPVMKREIAQALREEYKLSYRKIARLLQIDQLTVYGHIRRNDEAAIARNGKRNSYRIPWERRPEERREAATRAAAEILGNVYLS